MERLDPLTALEVEATNLRNNGQIDAAIKAYYELITKSEKAGDKRRAAGAQHMIGVANKVGNRTEAAVEAYVEAKKRYAAIGEEVGIGRVLRDEGIAYQYKQDYDHALPLLQQSVNILEKSDDAAELGISEVKLGNLYRLQKDMQQAEIWLRRGLLRLLKTNQAFYISTARMHLSVFLLQTSDSDGALSEINKAEEILQADGGEKKHLRRIAEYEGLKALIYEQKGDHQQALQCKERFKLLLSQLDEDSARYLREGDPELREVLS